MHALSQHALSFLSFWCSEAPNLIETFAIQGQEHLQVNPAWEQKVLPRLLGLLPLFPESNGRKQLQFTATETQTLRCLNSPTIHQLRPSSPQAHHLPLAPLKHPLHFQVQQQLQLQWQRQLLQ